jgi:hypothetical protein
MVLGSYSYLGRVTRMSILSVDHSVYNGHLATVSYLLTGAWAGTTITMLCNVRTSYLKSPQKNLVFKDRSSSFRVFCPIDSSEICVWHYM